MKYAIRVPGYLNDRQSRFLLTQTLLGALKNPMTMTTVRIIAIFVLGEIGDERVAEHLQFSLKKQETLEIADQGTGKNREAQVRYIRMIRRQKFAPGSRSHARVTGNVPRGIYCADQPGEYEAGRLYSIVKDLRWYVGRIGAERCYEMPRSNKWSFEQNLWHLTKQVRDGAAPVAERVLYFIDQGKQCVGLAAEIFELFEYNDTDQ